MADGIVLHSRERSEVQLKEVAEVLQKTRQGSQLKRISCCAQASNRVSALRSPSSLILSVLYIYLFKSCMLLS